MTSTDRHVTCFSRVMTASVQRKAQWLGVWSIEFLIVENPDSNTVLSHVESWITSFTPRSCSSLCGTNEYMTIDRGGYVSTGIFRALIAAWLDASQRSQDGVRLNGPTREECVKHIELA